MIIDNDNHSDCDSYDRIMIDIDDSDDRIMIDIDDSDDDDDNVNNDHNRPVSMDTIQQPQPQ